ncbi:hypothetical protein JJD41_16080 [Oxynema sp. CENA135]|nr:hypothetical protein [Oxynema sp. CENA135]
MRSSPVERVEPVIIRQFNSYIILSFEFEIEAGGMLQKLHGDLEAIASTRLN